MGQMRTERLDIAAMEEADATDMVAALQRSRDHLEPWVTVGVRLTERILEQRIAGWRAAGRAMFVARRRGDAGFVGCAGLRPAAAAPGALELSYWIDRDHAGQGLGVEMARAVRDFALAAANPVALEIVCHRENRSSMRVAEKLGFALRGEDGGMCRWIHRATSDSEEE
jgi:RimJ/RimL family protein N-acetyltransferase